MEKTENPEKNGELFAKDLKDLKEKYKLDFQIDLEFPDYNVLPVDLQLALAIIKKHNHVFVINFKELK